ncbi:ATP-binding protein [Streptomyces fuscichromogenes]|uniref:ATP-binding protein n=1 Tax=Streptomyces fuscichromogenes TaxID=1324013 RepID=UPI00382F421E
MTTTARPAGNLPTAFTSFVGRQAETAEIRRLLGETRLLTLTGPGGVGKTRLAIEAAGMTGPAFPDGVWLVDLAAAQHPSAVAQTVAAALRLPDQGPRPVRELLAEYLSERRALVVMDNCEHLVDGCVDVVRTMLEAAGRIRVLVTSRHSLGLPGEHLFTVGPLSVSDHAVELLRQRATAVRPELDLDGASRAAAIRLCTELDGLPLAIELAAAWLRTLTADQVADRLSDRFALLTQGSRTAPRHQRTLRATLDWSYDLCTPAERLLWNRLSVFAGQFTLDAVEDVCSGHGIARDEALDLLDRLVAQSVVTVCGDSQGMAYRLLESIRGYGRDRLAESGEEAPTRRRHRDYFLALAEGIADTWCGPEQRQGLERLRGNQANLLVALDGPEDPQGALALAAALRYHWCVGGFLSDGRRQLERVLHAAPEPSPARARALWVAGWVALRQGDFETLAVWLEEAEQLTERFADASGRGHVAGLRATARLLQGSFEGTRPLLEAALAWHRSANDAFGVVVTLFELALVETMGGHPHAVETGRRAAAVAEESGDRWGLAHVLWVQAVQRFLGDEPEECEALLRSAFELGQGYEDHMWAAQCLELLAYLVTHRAEHGRAAELLGAARALRQNVASSPAGLAPILPDHHALCVREIVQALGSHGYEEALARGGRRSTPAQALALAPGAVTPPDPQGGAADPLTRREREVAALIAQGMSNRRIAAELVLSPRTIDTHVENIRAKLGFDRRAQVASWWAARKHLKTPAP